MEQDDQDLDCTLEEAPFASELWSSHQDLHLVLECDRPLAGGTRHCLFDVDEVLIGRGTDRKSSRSASAGVSVLSLEVPDSRMSARHARLRRVDGHWLLDDTDSRNGSYVNGRRVASAHLTDGAALELGHTHFLFRSSDLPKTLVDGKVDRSETGSDEAIGTMNHELEGLFGGLLAAASAGRSVLLLGEAGIGKDTLARAIHDRAGRAGPFVPVHCMLLPRGGPEAGSDRRVLEELARHAERASGGTLFLDEIEGLSPHLQVSFLPLLRKARQTNSIHVISSARTNDPKIAIPRMPADFFAELAGFALRLPPLRDRREDLGLLIAQILARTAAVSPARVQVHPAMGRSILFHDWPYNLSELDACLRSAVTLSKDDTLRWTPANPLGVRSPSNGDFSVAPPRQSDRVVAPLPDPDPEFVQNVRRALKCNLSVSGLQKNGLVHSQMVLEATRGSGLTTVAAPALRDIFLAAIESMRNSPRGEKQSQVLTLTFIKPAATQQAAAEQLAMAFGTYRRYVTSALAELTNVLWYNESAARARQDCAITETAEGMTRESASLRLT